MAADGVQLFLALLVAGIEIYEVRRKNVYIQKKNSPINFIENNHHLEAVCLIWDVLKPVPT